MVKEIICKGREILSNLSETAVSDKACAQYDFVEEICEILGIDAGALTEQELDNITDTLFNK